VSNREHLRRLERPCYCGDAIVHWSLTIRDRKQGWLSDCFYFRFRELLTHACFRYTLACPIFCLMPDHIHNLWMGLADSSDQLNAMKHFRKTLNESLHRIGYELQDQSYDHVLRSDERHQSGFHAVLEYIARNPERARLIEVDHFAEYPYTGCIVPGYPELRLFEPDTWDKLDRSISYLRKHGLTRSGSC